MTIVAPVGEVIKYDTVSPRIKLITEIVTAKSATCLNDLKRRIAIRVGKTIKLDIKSAPKSLIPSTITSEQIIARIVSYRLVLMPIALAKSLSKVIAKMR